MDNLLSSEEDLKQAFLIRPTQRQVRFSFKCSSCGNICSKQLRAIKFPFMCTHCTTSVSNGNKDKIAKEHETKLKRYGDRNYLNKEKRHKTLIERYGGIGNASEVIAAKVYDTLHRKMNMMDVSLIANLNLIITRNCNLKA